MDNLLLPMQEGKGAAVKCKNCGREFDPLSKKQKHCSAECRVEYQKKARIARDERRKQKKIAVKRKKNQPLSQMNREARACGMTYGKYVALKYAPVVRNMVLPMNQYRRGENN